MNQLSKLDSGRKNRLIYYCVYTLVFAVLFFLCFGIHMLVHNKSLINCIDTLNMHYVSYLHAGRLFKNFFSTSEFYMWDPNIGYGSDIYNTMGGYFTDPLFLLTLWVPEHYSEAVFTAIMIFRLYLAGMSFSVLSIRRGNRLYSTLCGAVIYTFSACAYTGIHQYLFTIPMYIIPILIIGADDLYEKKKPLLYVIMLAYLTSASFYIVYMLAIMLVAYCILKWALSPRSERTINKLLSAFVSFLLYSLWSALIAAFSLIPTAYVMSNMGRLELKRYVPVLYDFDYYKHFYQGFITNYHMLGRDCRIGFSVIALLSLIILFEMKGKKYLQLKIETGLMTIGLLIPFVGYVFNGMNYPANRWVFFYALVMAYQSAVILPEIPSITKREKMLPVLILALYLFLGITVFNAGTQGFAVMAVCALVAGILFAFSGKCSAKLYVFLCVSLTCISVIQPAYYLYSKNVDLSLYLLAPSGKVHSLVTEDFGLSLVRDLEISDGTRFNHSRSARHYSNSSLLTGNSGIDFYFNMYNDYVDRFHQSIYLNTSSSNFGYDGLDNRSELMALSGVNYYLTNNDATTFPAGYSGNVISKDQNYKLLSSDYQNSLFTLFDSSISEEAFYSLSPVARQDVLMKTCVTNSSNKTDALSYININENEIPFIVESCDDGNRIANNSIDITTGNTGFVISFDEQRDGELYLCIKNLDVDDLMMMNYYMSFDGQKDGAIIPELTSRISCYTYANHLYGGKHDWLVNLGSIPGSVNQVRIIFTETGNYSFDSIKLYKRDLDTINSNIRNLDHSIENPAFSANKISLDCSISENKYLFASIPYSDGWTAYDNGEKIEILHGDIGFMAFRLSPGNHHLELRYETPGLKLGAAVSGISLLCFIGFSVYTHKKTPGFKSGQIT